MKDDESLQELIDLANAHIEGRLDASQRNRLQEVIASDEEARRVFVDFLHDHAALHWDEITLEADTGATLPFPGPSPASPSRRFGALSAAAAVIITIIGASWWFQRDQAPTTFATMGESKAARWESGDLPTAAGARLSTGKLRLAEGLATLRFDSGAQVVLEAPVEIALVDAMHCRLRSGTAVADIPESALGFRIATPSAEVVDYGTRFAVNVESDTGATRTQVFDGLVEVEHAQSGKIVQLKTGEENFVAGDAISAAAPGVDEGQWSAAPSSPIPGPEWTSIPTNKDAYIYARDIPNHQSDTLLLVKHGKGKQGPHRKAYLGFDLSALDPETITDAELTLHFSPTGWGLASTVPDSIFAVYAIVDPALDDWDASSLTWGTAPANLVDDGGAVSATSAVKLGAFIVEQGIQRGAITFRSDALTRFLRSENPDGRVTLVISRETIETDGGGLVHGFASRRHPTLPPPTLSIKRL